MAAVANAPSNDLAEPLNPDVDKPQTTRQKCQRGCLKYGGGLALVVFLLTWAVQGCIYWYAMFGCSERTVGLDNRYRSGEKSAYGDKDANMVPLVSELKGRGEKSWGGMPYDLHKISALGAGFGATVGTWSRYWGPIFDSFSYQDFESSSKTTMYMRRNLLRLGISHRMGRCDGKVPYIDISEGMNYFTNRWHRFWQMQTGIVLKIFADDKEIAWAKEMTHGSERSITFQGPGDDEPKYGDATLATLKNGNGKSQDYAWVITMLESSLLPTWAATGAVMLYADSVEQELKEAMAKEASGSKETADTPPTTLVSVRVVDKAGNVKKLYNATSASKIFLEAHNGAPQTPDPIPAPKTQAADVASAK